MSFESDRAHGYDRSWTALMRPARGASFFANGRPATEAALCAELSRFAYALSPDERQEGRAARILAAIGFDQVLVLDDEATECLLATDRLRALSVLVFQGTS